MPDQRLQRARIELPADYQFGDANPRQMRFFREHGKWERDAIRETTFAIDCRNYPMRFAVLNPNFAVRLSR